MRKAVFLDRDGTIIEDRGHLRDRSQVVFLPGAFDALRRLQKDFLLLIVTNQSGVAVGDITPGDVEDINGHVVAKLAEEGIRIVGVYVCPHSRQDGCECIKPKPHFLLKAQAEFGLDLPQSFTIGDHPHDVDLAKPVGAHGIYVLTGHGRKHLPELSPEAFIAADIGEAADRILAISSSRSEATTKDDRPTEPIARRDSI